MDYKGEVKFVKKYSMKVVSEIYVKVVCVGDDFLEEIVDGKQIVYFKLVLFNNGEIVGVFVVVIF